MEENNRKNFLAELIESVKKSLEEAINTYKSLGAEIEEISLWWRS